MYLWLFTIYFLFKCVSVNVYRFFFGVILLFQYEFLKGNVLTCYKRRVPGNLVCCVFVKHRHATSGSPHNILNVDPGLNITYKHYACFPYTIITCPFPFAVLGSSHRAATLREPGSYTLFAPTDAAFKKHEDLLNRLLGDDKCMGSESCFTIRIVNV